MFVSNTSTLILLAKISSLRSFLDNSPKIIIPAVVEEEIQRKRTFDTLLIEKEIENKRIIVQKDEPKKWSVLLNQFHLDAGEAATYIIYDKAKHKAILTDDGELIKLCKLEQIPFICALAIVVRLYEKKVITKEETLEKMEKLVTLGRYNQKIYNHFKQEVI